MSADRAAEDLKVVRSPRKHDVKLRSWLNLQATESPQAFPNPSIARQRALMPRTTAVYGNAPALILGRGSALY